MFCQSCGRQLNDGSILCDFCGNNTVKDNDSGSSILKTASRGKRFLTFIIDYFFLFILAAIFGIFGALILSIIYYTFFESIWQRTPGKWIMKTRVVKRDGKKPSFIQIVGRSFARLIPFEALSFLFNRNPIGWHDSLSNTFIVPQNYSEEDIKKIDFDELKKNNMNHILVVIILFLVGLVILGIISSVIIDSINSSRLKGQSSTQTLVIPSTN